jgi:death-on-curing protein
MAQGDGGQVAWLDDLVEAIRALHDRIIQESGGVLGEHTALLYSAVARPFQTAFGEPLYQTPVEQAAALMHGSISNHAFVDGNKRTAATVAMAYLVSGDFVPAPSELQVRLLGEVALATASGKLTAKEVARWIERIFAP